MNNYSNLRNDDGSEKAPNERRINVSSEDLIKKKESYWFLALVLTLLVIGTVVFYCAHTGGEAINLHFCKLTAFHTLPFSFSTCSS